MIDDVGERIREWGGKIEWLARHFLQGVVFADKDDLFVSGFPQRIFVYLRLHYLMLYVEFFKA